MTTSIPLVPVPTAEAESLFAGGSMRVPTAVKTFGIPRSTIYTAMQNGEMPFAILNGKRYVPTKSLIEWLAKGAVVAQRAEQKANG